MRDDAEFEQFVQGRGPALLRTACLLTGDRHTAEDLLQGVLERMYVRWSRLREHPEPYARRALVNAAINAWRFRRRRPEAPLLDRHDRATDDEQRQIDLRDGLVRALLQLPPKQRAVLVLRYFDDFSEREVAAALDCSLGTVKSQASRGLARLRELSDSDLLLDSVVTRSMS
jgi:RNA polymerase sigma-70 factor (sigma-E family)